MQSLFRFFRRAEHQGFEGEFRSLYQEPGVNLLAGAFAIAAFVFGIFYVVDATTIGMGFLGGVQTFRVVVVLAMLAFVFFLRTYKQVALKHYPTIAVISITLGLQAAAYVSYTARKDLSFVEVYWALTSSMETAIVLTFGFSRLPTRSTLLVSLGGTITALIYAMLLPGHAQQFGRVLTHLAVATVACFLLRATIESRERKVFVQGKEVLEKAQYINRLEVARLAAEQASESKAKFLASMSHEVRTPMNAVMQILEVIRGNLPPSDRELVDRGHAAGQALLRVLNTILDYTKLSSGGDAVHVMPVDLRDISRTVADLFQATASAKELELLTQCHLEEGCAVVMTDEVKVIEIVNNLVSNALKFTDRGIVELTITCARQKKAADEVYVELKVRDTGCGIRAEDQQDLFTAFYQGGSVTQGKPVGTGLGLAIVQQLADLLGGVVHVESTVGVGSTFSLTFPCKTAPREAVPVAYERRPTPSLVSDVIPFDGISEGEAAKPLRQLGLDVLLVEDHEVNAELSTFFLKAFGCKVTLAVNGQEAVDAFKSHDFDIVLMDCLMPVMSGFEATRKIREIERRRDSGRIPIVAVTANTLTGDREHCIEQGMDDFLAKPYTKDQLFSMLTFWGKHTSPSESRVEAA